LELGFSKETVVPDRPFDWLVI